MLMICVFAFFLSVLVYDTEAAPHPGDRQARPHSPPQLPPLPTSSSSSPTLIRISLAVMVLPVVFNTIAGRLGRLSNQNPKSLRLLYSQAIALYSSYQVCLWAGIILWIFAFIKASFDFGEAGFAVLFIVCSVSYLTESISSRLRQLLWKIPEFNRLHRLEVDGLIPTFRAMLYQAVNGDTSSSFPFDQRLALVVYALTKGHKRMLQILRCSMRPSVNCSDNIRELQQRLSDFDGLPHAVQHLVPEALASLVEVAVEQDHVAFRNLLSRVLLKLQHGHVIPLNTFIGVHMGRSCPVRNTNAPSIFLELDPRMDQTAGILI